MPVLSIWLCRYLTITWNVESTRFEPWTFTVNTVECWIRASFPPSSCDVCEQSLGCLVKIVVLFWESDIKLQHNSLQKEWPYPSRATYLQLCRLRTFLSHQTETSWEICSQKEKVEQKGASTLPLQPQISSLCTHFEVHVTATSVEYLQQQTLHLRTVYYPCWDFCGISVIVVGSLKCCSIHFNHCSTRSCSLLSWSVETERPHLQLYH